MKDLSKVVKAKIIIFSVLGLILGCFLNRFAYFLLNEKAEGIQKIFNSLANTMDSYSNQWLFFSFKGYPLLAFLLGLVLALLFFMLSTSNGKYRQGKEYGSARWATSKELKKFADSENEDNNLIFSEDVKMSLTTKNMDFDYQRNKNVLVCAGSGAG
ncbi:TPA: hypothetical protein ACJ815_002077, partial [Streptococcus pneumoniae]